MRLAYNGDVARRPPDGKTANLPAAQRVALKMGQLGETYRRIGVSAFAKHHQLHRDLLVIIAVSKSSLTSPDGDTPIRRPADTVPQPFFSREWQTQ